MKKNILLVALILLTIQTNAQNINSKVDTLLEVDGTIAEMENLITNALAFQKKDSFSNSDAYWEALEQRVSKKSIEDLKLLIAPIFSQIYTDSEIDSLISFYGSKTGKSIVEKKSLLEEQLTLPIMQWVENLDALVITEIEHKGKKKITPEEVEQFETEFKAKHGLQILNLNDLAIDQEQNIGNILIDFGTSNGLENITKVITVKNNSDKPMTFEKPLFLIDDDILFNWGNDPLEVGEVRDLKITLNAEQAENQSFSSFLIRTSDGISIPIGVKYDVPAKDLKFEISTTHLKYKPLKEDISEIYVFILKNTGKKEIHISDIEMDQNIAYLNYSKDAIQPNEVTEISVILSQALLKKHNIKKISLNLNVDLSKGKPNGFSGYANETLELSID